jgi:mannitol/fructose-specific phosphotransferase system IIA component (Ntr-type)/predicted DNA-binding protein YlxM (UPF0122 family)
MMLNLNERERRIIELLKKGDLSGEQLAAELNVSRRTIIRDIGNVNAFLKQFHVGKVVSGNNYHLEIDSSENLALTLKQAITDENRVLLTILSNPVLSISELAERVFLSKLSLRHVLKEMAGEYKNIFTIQAKPGVGIQLQFTGISPIDFFAELIFENPNFKNQLTTVSRWLAINRPLLTNAAHVYYRTVTPYITMQQVKIQAFATIACAPFVQQSRLGKIEKSKLVRYVKHFFAEKIRAYQQIIDKRELFLEIIDQILGKHKINAAEGNLDEAIFGHVVRTVMFSTLISRETQRQLSLLKAKNPFAFDFGYDLSNKLSAMIPNLAPEPDYLSLYALSAIGRSNSHQVKILMLADRQSLGAINELIIKQEIKNVSIMLVFALSTALRRLNQAKYDLILANTEFPDTLKHKFPLDMTFPGILNDEQLEELEALTKTRYFKKLLPEILTPQNTVILNEKSHDFFHALKVGLRLLESRAVVSSSEGQMVLDRENEGNQLVVNNVSIPHITVPKPNSNYRLFAIIPHDDVKLKDTHIKLMVVVLVSEAQRDKSGIFGYLYSVITSKKIDENHDFNSYQDVINFFSL